MSVTATCCKTKLLCGVNHWCGRIAIRHGRLEGGEIICGTGRFDRSGEFAVEAGPGGAVIQLNVADARIEPGPEATVVEIHSEAVALSFFLRDSLLPAVPIFVPEFRFAAGNDSRFTSYGKVAEMLQALAADSEFSRRRQLPEPTLEAAARRDWVQKAPMWLGLPRDVRIFIFNFTGEFTRTMTVTPLLHSTYLPTEKSDAPGRIWHIELGHGISCQADPWYRRLEGGVYPMPHLEYTEGTIRYRSRFFTMLECSELSEETISGTDAAMAYANMRGNNYDPEHGAAIRAGLNERLEAQEQVIFCGEIRAENLGRTAQYAWVKAPYQPRMAGKFDPESGYMIRPDHRIGYAFRCNGHPAPMSEMAVLLAPGESVTFEVILPHDFLTPERMARLVADFDFETEFAGTERFWRRLCDSYGKLEIPEQPLAAMVTANIPNLEMACIGAPGQMVGATVGEYGPIGSESLSLINWFLSNGRHELARRCLEFFLWRQQEDGLIQTFGGYELETGAVLWGCAEYLAYTDDWDWAGSRLEQFRRSIDYLRRWRERSCSEEARERGYYGLLDGRVADPEDYFHSFGLNGFAWAGLNGMARVFDRLQVPDAAELVRLAAEFRTNIRDAFSAVLARSPVVPFEDGTWAPLPPPWVENPGATCIYAEAEECFTHASFSARDFLVGAHYLVHTGVIEGQEKLADFLYRVCRYPYFPSAAGLTQPYYCRHDVLLWARGDAASYQSMYYNQLCGLVDPEIYTFYEHYFRCTCNKTHEAGWFLMQTRWMFYREEGNALYFCRVMPRRWFTPGQRVAVAGMYSRFGRIDFAAVNCGGTMRATVTVAGPTLPGTVFVRLPHPDGCMPVRCDGGEFDRNEETVRIDNFTGEAEIVLSYDGKK